MSKGEFDFFWLDEFAEIDRVWLSGLGKPSPEMIAAGHRVMQHGLATPADIWDAMYRAAMGEPLESIEPKVKP